ncbi:MAG: hypothetical protein RL757_1975 [Bacteroidota bacterium]
MEKKLKTPFEVGFAYRFCCILVALSLPFLATQARAQADSVKKTPPAGVPSGLPGGEKLTVPPIFVGDVGATPARRVAPRRLTWQDSLRMVTAADSTARQVIGNATRSLYSVKPKAGAVAPPPLPTPPPVQTPKDTPKPAAVAPIAPVAPPKSDTTRKDTLATVKIDTTPRVTASDNPLEKLSAAATKDSLEKMQADSLIAANAPPSLFSREIYTRHFLFFTMLVMLIMMVIALQMGRGVVSNVYQSLINDSTLRLVYRDQIGWGNLAYLSLYVLFWINLGIFIFLTLNQWGIQTGLGQGLRMLLCIGGVGLVYFIKHLLLYVLAAIFPVAKEVKLYNFIIIITGIVIGLVLAPVNIFMLFASDSLRHILIYVGLGAIGLMYVVRVLRSFFVNASLLLDNKFHFLLYLCAVEIAPALILVKFILNQTR